MSYHAILQQEPDRWVGWIAEFPEVRAEEDTRDKLVEALKASITQGDVGNDHSRECIDISNGNGSTRHPVDVRAYDFWKGMTLDEIDAMQGVGPIEDPRSLLGGLTEEDFEGFDEFIREHRQSSMAGDSVL
jgi:hypothetical protein